MAIAATGAVSFADLRSEFVGGSSAISFSDLYRGGSNIRAKAANNNSVNLAANVPTSGAIDVSSFRSQAKGFRYTFSAGATDQNASALFGSDYSVDYPKEIVIDSGVELGATSTAEEALEIDSGGVGTITVTNNGTLSGAGGAAGADGGDAFEAAIACTFINNGTVRAGGGGGGTGGNGTYNSDGSQILNGNTQWQTNSNGSAVTLYYGGYTGISYGGGQAGVTQYAYGGGYLVKGSFGFSTEGSLPFRYYIFFRTIATSTGGAGGVGAGYNQSVGTGVAGTNNAGSGGDGGSFGASGNSGANGTSTNGAAGGAGGKYLRGSSFVTFTNNGTVQGGTA